MHQAGHRNCVNSSRLDALVSVCQFQHLLRLLQQPLTSSSLRSAAHARSPNMVWDRSKQVNEKYWWIFACWCSPKNLSVGAPLVRVTCRCTGTTDMSLLSRGAVCQERSVRARWNRRLQCLHISALELLVMQLMLRHFRLMLPG